MENFTELFMQRRHLGRDATTAPSVSNTPKSSIRCCNLRLPTWQQKDRLAGELFLNQGITFTVYSDNAGIERIFLSTSSRVITAKEWEHVEKGIQQRLKALNMFLKDVYNDQQILKDGIIPAQLVASCPHFLREVHGIKVPLRYLCTSAVSISSVERWHFYILEDNLRTPSGYGYMLETARSPNVFFPIWLPPTMCAVYRITRCCCTRSCCRWHPPNSPHLPLYC